MFETRKLILREFNEQDIDIIWKWKNDPSLTLYESSNPYPKMNKEEIRKNYLNDKRLYAVCIKELENKLIGEASYWYPDVFIESTVEMGVSISEEAYRNMGYGAECSLALSQIIFNNPNIHKLIMCIGSHNNNSKSPVGKLAVCEGVLKDDRFIDGQYYNTYIYGVLRSEYETIMNRLQQRINI